MDFLGVGPLEFLFIALIALIIFGPKDLVKAGRTIGAFLRRVIISPEWHYIQKATREVQNLPTRLIREAGLEEAQQELNGVARSIGGSQNERAQWENDIKSWTTPSSQPSKPPTSPTTPPENE